jgi:hypothetical protein
MGILIRLLIGVIALPACSFSVILLPPIEQENLSKEWKEWPKLQCEMLSRDFCDSRFGCRVENGLCIYDPNVPTVPVDCASLFMDVSLSCLLCSNGD